MSPPRVDSQLTLAPVWRQALERAGFACRDGRWRHNGLAFACDGKFVSLEDTAAATPCGWLGEGFDQPGLWKWLPDETRPRRVFEVLASDVTREAEDEAEDDGEALTLERLLAWGMGTADGRAPEDWRPPSREWCAAWLPPSALSVVAGACLRQGEVLLQPARFALQLPILPELPPDLPESRRWWLAEVLRDAQCRWPLVRLGLTGDAARPAVMARVDLTGAPRSRRLLSTSLEGLKCLAAWLVESADLLADTSLVSAALEVCLTQTP